jgi:hypothetical protein
MAYNNDDNNLAPTHEEQYPPIDLTPAPVPESKASTPAEKRSALNKVLEALEQLDSQAQASVLRSTIFMLNLEEDMR